MLDWSKGDWIVGILNYYQLSYKDQNGGCVGSYLIWNVYGFWKVIKSVMLLVGVCNLFDMDLLFLN